MVGRLDVEFMSEGATVRAWFDDPDLPETPSLAEGLVEVLLSSDDLLDAARAHRLGDADQHRTRTTRGRGHRAKPALRPGLG